MLKWEALFQLNVLIWASYFRIKQFLYIWQNNYFTDIPDIYSYVATSEILVHCSLKCGSCSCKKGLGKIHGIKKYMTDWSLYVLLDLYTTISPLNSPKLQDMTFLYDLITSKISIISYQIPHAIKMTTFAFIFKANFIRQRYFVHVGL